MNVLAIVPARGASKRVPRKNLRTLGGKSLTARAVEACLGAQSLGRIVISSDSAEILATARAYPSVLPLQRPPEFSTDASPAIDFVRHALKSLEVDGASRFDAVAIIQPSSPFTASADIDATVSALAAAPHADSAVTVMELEHSIHPAKLKRMDGKQLLPYIEDERGRMAVHELPKVFVRNCSVYVTRRACLEKGSILGDVSFGVVMPRERSLDINDEFDWSLAEFLFQRSGSGQKVQKA